MKKVKILTAVCCLLSLSTQAQTYQLRYNLSAGKKYLYNIVSAQFTTSTENKQKLNTSQTLGTDYLIEVKEAANPGTKIKVTYKRIYSKEKSGNETFIADSDDQDTTKVNTYAYIKDGGFGATLLPDGAVQNITGIEALHHYILSKVKSTSGIETEIFKQMITQEYSAEKLSQTLETFMKIFPKEAVKIGDSWQIESLIKLGIPLKVNTKYTLKAVKNGIASISINGNLSQSEAKINPANSILNFKGTNIGNAEIDLKTGLMVNYHTRLEISGNFKNAKETEDVDLQSMTNIIVKEVK